MFRKVAAPSNPRGLALGWLIGPEQDAKIRAALPDWAIALESTSPLSVTLADIQNARRITGVGPNTPIGVMAHSAGVQSLRAVMMANLIPANLLAAVHISDGTHADVPPEAQPWKIQIWHDLIKRALAGEIIFTATCTQMTYTKDIKAGQKGRAWPTSWVLGRAMGLGDGALKVGDPIVEGLLYVEQFPSDEGPTARSAAAHNNQLSTVLPATLATYWSRQGPPPPPPPETHPTLPTGLIPAPGTAVTEPAPAPEPEWLDPSRTLGWRLAVWAMNEATNGVKEVPKGSNDGPRLREYDTAPNMRDGRPIKVPRTAWCVKALSYGLHVVALDRRLPTLRVSGFEYETDAKKDGTWVKAGPGVDPEIGWLAIFLRPGGEDWWRHGAVVTDPAPGFDYLWIAEGNHNDGWNQRSVSKADPLLLGYVRIG